MREKHEEKSKFLRLRKFFSFSCLRSCSEISLDLTLRILSSDKHRASWTNYVKFRVYLELIDFPRRPLNIYICILCILTRVYDVRNSWTVRAALILSRVMSDLAPTGAYFLLRCLNIILTMFFRPVAASRNPKFCEVSTHVFDSCHSICWPSRVALKNSSIPISFFPIRACNFSFTYLSVCLLDRVCRYERRVPFKQVDFLIAAICLRWFRTEQFLAKRYLSDRSFVSWTRD